LGCKLQNVWDLQPLLGFRPGRAILRTEEHGPGLVSLLPKHGGSSEPD